MSDTKAVAGFMNSLPEEWKNIDVLVNNAGMVKGVAKSPDINAEDIDVMMATNVTGLITMTQAVMKVYKSRDDGTNGRGDIINVGSIAGREGYPGGSIYCATKAAVRTFTEALRKETVDSRIRVMEVDPGQVETEFSLVRFGGDEEKARKVYEGCEPRESDFDLCWGERRVLQAQVTRAWSGLRANESIVTPDDIAEIIVFMAGRRENVVVADALVFPSHQVSTSDKVSHTDRYANGDDSRVLQLSCTGNHRCAKDSKCTLRISALSGLCFGYHCGKVI